MTTARYSAYKPSGYEWLGDVPSHWRIDRLKASITLCRNGIWGEEPQGDENDIPCVRVADFDRQRLRVELDDPTIRNVTDKERSGRLLSKGELLLEKSGGGENQPVGCVVLYDDARPAVCSNFVARVVPAPGQNSSYWRYVHAAAYAVRLTVGSINQTSGIQNLDQARYFNEYAAFPPPSEQRAIACFLDRETAKIDTLVEEQKHLIELQREEVQSMVLASRSAVDTDVLRFANAAQVVSRPVLQKEGELYRPLGMYNRGRGIFHKELREMDEMGDSDFFWVKRGDLVISGQFAWEGAVGLAGEEEDGCVVSHRYPVLRGREGVALTEYLYALLLTKHGDFMLNESSWGAAGRNRPLNLGLLLKEKIWVPTMRTQLKVANAVHWGRLLAAEINTQLTILQERRSALISAAVTGKVDVRHLVPQLDGAAA